MFLLYLVFLYKSMFADGRVYCADSNASPWKALGLSCPVNCGHIITAVERLKMNDYQNLFNSTTTEQPKKETLRYDIQPNKTTLLRKIFNIKTSHLKDKLEEVNIFYDILKNEKALRSLRTAVSDSNMNTCPMVLKKAALKPMHLKRLDKKCFRRYNRDDFLKTFTDVLNGYTRSEYQFTEEVTAMLLKRILGKNMDLRHGVFDVNKIITYLSSALKYHRAHLDSDLIIELRSKHCLTVFLPGCFCRPGFVEKSGQCVLPPDCFPNTKHSEYLARIVIH